MGTNLALFPVTVVGSWPCSREVLRTLRDKRVNRIDDEEFDRVTGEAILDCLRLQEEAGVDLVSDGEQRRDNFISFVADKLENVKMLTAAELLDYVEDKAGFEEILGTLDVPAYSRSNPAAVGKIRRAKPLALEEYKFLRAHTGRAIQVALPGRIYLRARCGLKDCHKYNTRQRKTWRKMLSRFCGKSWLSSSKRGWALSNLTSRS